MEGEGKIVVVTEEVEVGDMMILLTFYLQCYVQVVVVEVELELAMVMVKVELEERAGHQLSYMHCKILPLMESSQQMEIMAEMVYFKMVGLQCEFISFH